MPRRDPPTKDPQAAADAPPFGRQVIDDLSRGDFGQTMHRDLQEVYEFYLDPAARARLDEMGPFTRWSNVTIWMLKNSILRLSPTRRLLLLGSTFFFIQSIVTPDSVGPFLAAFLGLLLILLLELKDKLMAQGELATGRAVQRALMPEAPPHLPGWDLWLTTEPANDVGGDLVDYLSIGRERLGVALGDVAGKGLGAALYMAKLQATLRAIAPEAGGLPAMGARINDIFCRDGVPGRFASLVYLEAEADSARVRVLNAGHFPPVVVRQEGLEVLPKGGPALGLVAGIPYREHVVTLEPGDLLVVYSDGVTEARNAQGDFFDDERLLRLLPSLRGRSAAAAGDRLLHMVRRFVGDTRPHDDLSLVLLRHTVPATAEQPILTQASQAASS